MGERLKVIGNRQGKMRDKLEKMRDENGLEMVMGGGLDGYV